MTKARVIKEGVSLLGAIDWDRRLFDALIPLPDGTSYNAYLIVGRDKTALIDTVDPARWEALREQLEEVPRLDYVIIQHVEQDHSGALPLVLARYPEARVVTNARCKGMVTDHLHVAEDRFIVVEDGGVLPLGGKTLKFVLTPWVHFPETMCTWLEEDQLLFTCDFFGSHLATSDLWADECQTLEPAKRYYAEIMMPFSSFVVKDLEKLKPFAVQAICPSHGPLWRRPEFIIDAYKEWTDAQPRNLVCLAYVTMHGSTQVMAERMTSALLERGVAVERFDLQAADLGKLAMCLVDAGSIVIATPTVHAGPHPLAMNAAFLADALRPKARHAAVIGSYGWGGKTVEKLAATLSHLKLELLDPVLCKGLPRAADLEAIDRLADTIAAKHAGLPPRRSA